MTDSLVYAAIRRCPNYTQQSCLFVKRRLGYLLDRAGHARQANALQPFVKKAKTAALLDPSVKPLMESLADLREKDSRWKLLINERVEIDF